jgi:hypothetical protein
MSSVGWKGVNWSRGLTRLYLVLWTVWACHYIRLAILECMGGLQPWTEIIWAVAFVLSIALLAPAFLLLPVRWVLKGFGRHRVGLHQVWRGQRWGT